MKKCVLFKHFLILVFLLISTNVITTEVTPSGNITLIPSLELPRKVAKRLTFLKNNISNIGQIPQFAYLCDCVEQGQSVIDKDIIQAGLQELNQYSFALDASTHSSEADLIKQYTQKIKSDLNEVEVILIERSLPSCCQNISCCNAVAPTTKINTCTKPTCFGKAEETGTGDGNFDGKVRINSLAESSDCGSGALVVKGGLGVGGDLNVCGKERISNRAPSLDCAHGALVVEGGVGIGLNLNVCGDVAVASTTESTDCTTGASVIAGGQAIGGNLNVCGKLHVFNDRNSRSCDDGAVVIDGALGIGKNTNICGLTHIQNTTDSNKCTEGALVVDGGAGFGKNVNICGKVHIFDTTNSGACNSGALVVDGGVGIAKDTNICGALNVEGVISTNSYFSINGSSVVASNIANCNLSVGDNTNPIANGYSNTAVGESAMQNNQVGVRDTALGCQPLQNNIRGNDDTAIGAQALINLSGSDRNTACGSQTSFEALDVNDTVAVGYAALHDNQRDENTACGSYALTNNQWGLRCTAVGFESLKYNLGYEFPGPPFNALQYFITPSCNNTALGHQSQLYNVYGYNNTAIGSSSLQNNILGFENTACGNNALYTNQSSYNTAVGGDSMLYNTLGTYNTACGQSSLVYNLTGFYNTSIGCQSMVYNVLGYWNTAVGFDALTLSAGGFYNCVVGANALDAVIVPFRNTVMGYHSISGNELLPLPILNDNVAVGYRTLEFTRTDASTCVGTESMQANVYGVRNTAVGFYALRENIGVPGSPFGHYNTVMGYRAVQTLPTGYMNTVVGCSTVLGQFGGIPANRNTMMGYASQITSGYNNVVVGDEIAVSGQRSVIIGSLAMDPAKANIDIRDLVVIGYKAYANPAIEQGLIAQGAVVIGYNAYSEDVDPVSIGYRARTVGYRSVGIGQLISVRGEKNVAIAPQGDLAGGADPIFGDGIDNVMIGDSTTCYGDANVVIGGIAVVKGQYNTLVGYYNNNAPAGTGIVKQLFGSTQIGAYSSALGDNTVSVGYNSHTVMDGSIAVGQTAKSTAQGAIAIGQGSTALPTAFKSVVIGSGASAEFNGDIVIGNGQTSPFLNPIGNNIVIGRAAVNTICIGADPALATPASINIGSLLGHPIGTGVSGGVFVFGFRPSFGAEILWWNPANGELTTAPCPVCLADGPLEGEWTGNDDLIRSQTDDASEKLLALTPQIMRNRGGSENEESIIRIKAPEDPKEFCPELLVQDKYSKENSYLQLDKSFIAMLNVIKKHEHKITYQQEKLEAQQAEIEELNIKYNSLKTIIDKMRK